MGVAFIGRGNIVIHRARFPDFSGGKRRPMAMASAAAFRRGRQYKFSPHRRPDSNAAAAGNSRLSRMPRPPRMRYNRGQVATAPEGRRYAPLCLPFLRYGV